MKKTIFCVFGALVLGACSAPEPANRGQAASAYGGISLAERCLAQGYVPVAEASNYTGWMWSIVRRASEEDQAWARANPTHYSTNSENCATVYIDGRRVKYY